MQVKMRLRMPKWQSKRQVPKKVLSPKRSHGQRLRLRKSLILMSTLKIPSTRKCWRKCQKSFALLELFWLKNSRLVDHLLVHSSKTLLVKIWSSQSVNNTTALISVEVPKPSQLSRRRNKKRLKPPLKRKARKQRKSEPRY